MTKPDKSLGKADVRRQAQRLRESAEWNPDRVLGKRASAAEQWAQSEQDNRHKTVYQSAVECADCTRAQETLGDSTALCEDHLMAAMGLEGAE